MLRLFIISLLVFFVDRIICGVYTEELNNYALEDKLDRNEKHHEFGRYGKSSKRHKRQDQEDNEEEVAQIDLNHFIEEGEEDGPSYNHRLSNYEEDEPIDLADIEDNLNIDLDNYENVEGNLNTHIDHSLPNNKLYSPNINIVGQKHTQPDKTDNVETSDDLYRDDLLTKVQVAKKSILTKLRLPFFSLNKSNDSRTFKDAKNDKKSKCSKCSTQKSKESKVFDTNLTKTQGDINDSQEIKNKNNIMKRSYGGMLCPKCKRKFVVGKRSGYKKAIPEIIHNSRQFYQHENGVDDKNTDVTEPNRDTTNDITNNFETKRKKRDFNNDKARQLKELDEVQKKIDSLEIRMPKITKDALSKYT